MAAGIAFAIVIVALAFTAVAFVLYVAGGETRRSRLPPGPTILVGLALANLAVWIAARPDGVDGRLFAGEICGAEAVLFFTYSLVLATLLPPIETAFGGLDRAAVWHRRSAVAGVAFVLAHRVVVGDPQDPFATSLGTGLGDLAIAGLVILSLWALAPRLRGARGRGLVGRMARATYERWLTAHRLTGVFVGAAVAHALIVDPVLHRSTPLRVVFIVVGAIGIVAYVYREFFARFFIPVHGYTVSSVTPVSDTSLAVRLAPQRERLQFTPGQFVVVEFGGRNAWQRHPFSVSSGAGDPELEVTIKAVGDYTRALGDRLAPGVPTRVIGPFGDFDYRLGGNEQVWIAGGVRRDTVPELDPSANGSFDRQVDFFYSVAHEGDAIDRNELETFAREHPSFRLHVIATDHRRPLTADEVLGGSPEFPWIYMCGSRRHDALVREAPAAARDARRPRLVGAIQCSLGVRPRRAALGTDKRPD
jgi:predicted ferric reductase